MAASAIVDTVKRQDFNEVLELAAFFAAAQEWRGARIPLIGR
jgi:hypothetical protein